MVGCCLLSALPCGSSADHPPSPFNAQKKRRRSKLKAGYDLAYLGDLNQRGYQVTLWRIRFKSGGDDLLATLSMRDGKVGGYWIQ
jgi:hypothetical protein